MDDMPSIPPQNNPPVPPAPALMLCPQCHQPVTPADYFCPNCGKKLSEPPLSTSIGTQAWIYIFSAVLPIICYLAISYWPAIKYFKSADPQAKQIGMIAIAILTISSIITFWLGIVWIQQTIQSSINSVGNLGGGL
jgi:Double zinc ribbon